MNLTQLRQSKGFYQKKVAEWLGITRRTMRNLESGNTKNINNYSKRLAEIYSVDEKAIIEAFNKSLKNKGKQIEEADRNLIETINKVKAEVKSFKDAG